VFVVNDRGLIRGFEAATGQPAWTVHVDYGTQQFAYPTALNGLLYLSEPKNTIGGPDLGDSMLAIHTADGTIAWTQTPASGGRASVTVNGSATYLATPNSVNAWSASTGAPQWTQPAAASYQDNTMALSGGRLYQRGGLNNTPGSIRDALSGNIVGSFAADPIPAFDGTRGFFLSGGSLEAKDMTTPPGAFQAMAACQPLPSLSMELSTRGRHPETCTAWMRPAAPWSGAPMLAGQSWRRTSIHSVAALAWARAFWWCRQITISSPTSVACRRPPAADQRW
jgi:hypothetical protein